MREHFPENLANSTRKVEIKITAKVKVKVEVKRHNFANSTQKAG